jgi:hemerythrin-like metal-binding protein
MKKYNYYDLYNHQKSHEKFKEKIKNYQKRYYQSIIDGEDNESMFSNIIVFLVNWISVHIREVDKQYVPYIKGE